MAEVSRELPKGHSGKRRVSHRASGRSHSSKPATQAESGRDMSLPSQENVPPQSLDESVIFIHGEKSVGKTTIASYFPKSLVLMFERGRRNLPIMQLPRKGEPALDWNATKEYVSLFLESDYQTLVIDTIDGAYIACFNHVCAEHEIKTPEDHASPYLIWDEIAVEFGALIYLVQQSDKALILTSHSKPVPLVAKRKGLKRDELEEATVSIDRMTPTCKPAAFKIIQEMADFVFYYGYRDGHRAMTVRSPLNIYWTACGIGDKFLDPDGTPIETFKVPSDPKEAYDTLQDAYDNKLRDIDYIAPAKPRSSGSGRSLSKSGSRSSRSSSHRRRHR